MKACSEPQCRREHHAIGMCQVHYNRWRWMRNRALAPTRRIPKPGKRKPGPFDLAQCGAVGWRVRS